MSQTGPRPNDTDDFRYLGNSIWPYLGPSVALPSVNLPDATVYKVGSNIKALDNKGNLISSGVFQTDDQTVIQAALDNIHNTGQGFGTLFIKGQGDTSANRYLIRSKLTIYDGITVQGDSMRNCTLYLNDNVNDHMFSYPGTGSDAYFITFQDIHLNGNYANNSGASDLIHLDYSTNQAKDPMLFRVFLEGAARYCYYHKNAWNDRVLACIIEYGQSYGAYIDGSSQDIKIDNCAFKFNVDALNVNGTGACTGASIVNNEFIQQTHRGVVIPTTTTSGGCINGNCFNNNGTATSNTYDDVQCDADNWTIVGNFFYFVQQRWAISSFNAALNKEIAVGNVFYGYGTNTPVNSYTKYDVLGNYNQKGQQSSTYNGSTAGTAISYQNEVRAGLKIFTVNLSAYQDAGHTITYPVAFTNTPSILTDASGGATTNTTGLTLPNTVGAAKTGNVIVMGY